VLSVAFAPARLFRYDLDILTTHTLETHIYRYDKGSMRILPARVILFTEWRGYKLVP
jgi:hypothetical protein